MRGAPRRSIPRLSEPSSPSKQLLNGTTHYPEPSLDETEIEPVKAPALARVSPLGRPKRGRPKTLKKDKTKGPFDLSIDDDEPEPSIDDLPESTVLPTDDYALPEDDLLPEEDTNMDTEPVEPVPFPKGKTMEKPTQSEKTDTTAAQSKGKKRGRPGRKSNVVPDKEEAPAASKPGRGKRKAPLAEKDPNRPLKAPRANSKAPPSRAGSVLPSSNLSQRAETPATDSGAYQTRSGRNSIRPLASWRGEKFVFTERRSRDSLPGILEVVRTDEMPPPPRPTRRGQSRGPRRGRRAGTLQRDIQSEIDDEEDMEPWEQDPGIHEAVVMAWDPDTGTYSEEGSDITGNAPYYLSILGYLRLTIRASRRNRLLCYRNRDAGHPTRIIQIRQNPHPPILRLRNGPSTSWRREAHQEFEEDADGLLCVLGEGNGQYRNADEYVQYW